MTEESIDPLDEEFKLNTSIRKQDSHKEILDEPFKQEIHDQIEVTFEDLVEEEKML